MKVRTLLGAVLASATLSGCGLSLQQLPKLGGINVPYYSVNAQFADVLNLPANAQVREGPEVVGQVGSISVKAFRAVVQLKIARRYSLPEGTTAEVRFDNPLGEEYVLLTPPVDVSARTPLTNGSLIPQASTDTAPSVEDTFAALSSVLNGGGISSLGTIIHELNQTFAGNQPQIRDLLSSIDTAVTSLASNSNAVDGALASIGSLVQQLNEHSGSLVTGIDTIGPAMKVLVQENSQLEQLLLGFTNLSTVGQALVAQSGQNSVNAVRALVPVVQQLVGVEQQLAPDLADLSQFEAETPKLTPGNYLQVSVTANVNINSAPTVATAVAAPGPVAGSRAVAALLEGGLR